MVGGYVLTIYLNLIWACFGAFTNFLFRAFSAFQSKKHQVWLLVASRGSIFTILLFEVRLVGLSKITPIEFPCLLDLLFWRNWYPFFLSFFTRFVRCSDSLCPKWQAIFLSSPILFPILTSEVAWCNFGISSGPVFVQSRKDCKNLDNWSRAK